jgi:hypothetical protein
MSIDPAKDIEFNKYQLPEVCEQHASKYWYWANKLAKAKNALGDSEDKLKLVTSQQDSYYRENWEKNEKEWGKKTEGSVAGRVNSDDKVREAKNEFISNQHEVNTLIAYVSAFDHRKGMIDNEVKLLIGGFYATPNGGKKEGGTEQAEREVRRKLKKKA